MIERRRPGGVGPWTYDVPIQTTDDTEQPTIYDGSDAFFAAVLKDEGITPSPCGASRVEMLPMPVVIEDDLLAAFGSSRPIGCVLSSLCSRLS